MKSRKRTGKKFIFGLVAVVTAAGILALDLTQNVSVAEAKQPTFRYIDQNYTSTGLKILEITPTTEDAELGYFVGTGVDQASSVRDATRGTKFNRMIPDGLVDESLLVVDDAEVDAALEDLWNSGNAELFNYDNLGRDNYYTPWSWGQSWANPYFANEAEAKAAWQNSVINGMPLWNYAKSMMEQRKYNQAYANIETEVYIAVALRRYGMIYPLGPDPGAGRNGGYGANSLNPIFAAEGKGLFALMAANDFKEYDIPVGTTQLGHYVTVPDGEGAYRLKDGYVIGDGAVHDLYDEGGQVVGTTELEENVIYQVVTTTQTYSSAIPVPNQSTEPEEDANDEEEQDTAEVDNEGLDSEAESYSLSLSNAVPIASVNVVSGNTTVNTAAPIAAPAAAVPRAQTAENENNGVVPYAVGDPVVIGYIRVDSEIVMPDVVEYVGSGGNADFEYQLNLKDRYYGYTTSKVVFLSGNRKYRVGGWLAEYILGDAALYSKTLDYRQRNADIVTKEDIEWANLIYISGTAAEYKEAGVYLTDDIVVELYNQSAVHHKAIIMDYLITDDDIDGDGYNNFDKLALLLWQDDQQQIASLYENYFREVTVTDLSGNPTKYEIVGPGILYDNEVMTTLRTTRLSGYNGNFAVNNVYSYNHHISDFSQSLLSEYQTNALDNLANGDLASPYSAAAMNGGFQAVLAYIKLNNENLPAGKMVENYVTPAIAIQFILCYRGENLMLSKGQFTVLEIQPSRQFKFNSTAERRDYALETEVVRNNRDAFIANCLSDTIVKNDSQDLVAFDSMTIDEFNTMQDDLLTTYDVIYIGALHDTYFNNEACTARVITSNQPQPGSNPQAMAPVYNDRSMTGYVYYNVGDTAAVGTARGGEYYSSRDLTVAKLTELKQYLESSGLIIVDGDLMKSSIKGNVYINPTDATELNPTGSYDHGRMDNSSNMYALFAFARGAENTYYSNFVSEADLAYAGDPKLAQKADLTNSLNRERLNISFAQTPNTYTYSSNGDGDMNMVSYLSADGADGKYYLDFEFSFTNTAEVASPTEFYLIHFYQDMNANGRFEAAEEKFDYQVTFSADGSQAANGVDADGVTRYSLNAEVMYKLRRQVPADEGGFINWCIRIEKLTNSNVYCQQSGYTAIKPREQKYINILQIQPDNGTINLENLSESDALYKYLHAKAVEDQYIITVRTITVRQFQQDTIKFYENYINSFGGSQEALWADYFNNFQRTDPTIYYPAEIKKDEDSPMSVNMIILGFGADYTQFAYSPPVYALETYIESTKPLLTSNNVVGSNITDPNNRTLNYVFLQDFAQDRYGYTYPLYNAGDTKIDPYGIYNRVESDPQRQQAISNYLQREATRQAVAYVPGSGRNSIHAIPVGYTNDYVARTYRTRATDSAFINDIGPNALYYGSDPTANASRTFADQMNEGQIAHYPFEVGGSILLSRTQAQRFQLDLDSDSDNDGLSDVVVWYTLGDMATGDGTVIKEANIYSATPGDGINNYYVYNAGTVTFTGMGATPVGNLTAAEGQLFVNTLIAAYEAGLVNPTVSFYETADSNASMLDSIAVPYDKNITGDNTPDSSIMLNESGTGYRYKFINPNTQTGVNVADATKAYFKIQDSNNVRGAKSAKVTFYMAVDGTPGANYTLPDGGTVPIQQIQLNDNTVVTVVRIPIDIYNANFTGAPIGRSTAEAGYTNPKLDVATMYGFYVPMSYIKDKGAVKIYIQADTSYEGISSSTGELKDNPLGTAYDMFTIIKQDLLKLD
ncbi:MAG: DUF5057 domain-containing protein [Lachnospiraceae bacterium]|nr:DUF5057 domain-containing protein [Lachnospiraceae bacterium]